MQRFCWMGFMTGAARWTCWRGTRMGLPGITPPSWKISGSLPPSGQTGRSLTKHASSQYSSISSSMSDWQVYMPALISLIQHHCCHSHNRHNHHDCGSKYIWAGLHWGASWWWRLLNKLPIQKEERKTFSSSLQFNIFLTISVSSCCVSDSSTRIYLRWNNTFGLKYTTTDRGSTAPHSKAIRVFVQT